MRNKSNTASIKKRFWNQSIRSKLIISFLFLLIVPLAISNYISYNSVKTTMDGEISNSAQNSMNTVNQSIDQYINAQKQNISFLSSAIDAASIVDNQDKKTRTLLSKIQGVSTNVEQTFVGTENGSFINYPTSFKNPPGYDPRQRPWYQEAMKQKGKVFITAPYVSKSSKKMVVTVCEATKDGKGVVAVNLKLNAITNMLSSIKIGKSGYLELVDQNNAYISSPNNKAGSTAKDKVFNNIQQKDNGEVTTTIQGDQKFVLFNTNKETGWKVIGMLSGSEVTNAVHPILYRTLLVLIIALILGGLIIYFVIRSIISPIKLLIRSAEKVSEGDLSDPVELKSNDEISQLGNAFEHMRQSLVSLITKINDKSTSLAAYSEELSASTTQNSKAIEYVTQSIQELGIGAESQSRSIEVSTQSAMAMVSTIQEVAKNSNEVAFTAVQTSDVVNEGNKAIDSTVSQMQFIKETVSGLASEIQRLSDHSVNIGKIIGVITEIAEQTNLLALNAAIEAARAGEQGKGFGVVASEIRKLAEQSAQSTEQIRKVITTIQEETSDVLNSMEVGKVEVDKGINIANNAGESFKNIKDFVANVTDQIHNVSAAVQQISSGTEDNVKTFEEVSKISEQTAASVQEVSATTEEQLASIEEISSSAETLSSMAEELQEIIDEFKI
jgi:methyl-accepting chemotaxis protein